MTTEQLTKVKMLEYYAHGYLVDPVNTGDRIYARTSLEAADEEEGYIVVWCNI